MSVSWAYFRPHGPPRFQMLQNQLPECWRAFDEAGGEHHEHQLGIFPATWPPRFQMLQNQLPECWRAFDEAGGEHHEHQLGIFPATWPP